MILKQFFAQEEASQILLYSTHKLCLYWCCESGNAQNCSGKKNFMILSVG